MKISFVTTNRHKFEEAKKVLSEFGIDAEWINQELLELDSEIESIARHKAKNAADRLKKPVVVEDTGIFFEAYNNFPGQNPKFIFESIGYEGIFRLLEGKSRKAYFRTVAAYCEPGKEPMLFDGVMKGALTEEIHDEEKDAMPYDRIFIIEGHDRTISGMTMEDKNRFSHRAQAFRKLGEFLKKKNAK